MREAQLQAKIIKHLANNGYLCIKLIQTNLNGIPDLLCLKDGKALFIEVKSENGKVRPLQHYRHKQLQEQGFEVMVVNDIASLKFN
jgi:Holliday junction resolvase